MPIRGCGSRVAGGIYFECLTGPGGLPLEHFLYCPPPPVPPEWGITPVSSRLIEGNVADWIGGKHYPNVLDYVEEVRRFGLSGRLPRNFPFNELTSQSRFIPVHAKAILVNWQEFLEIVPGGVRDATCPKYHHTQAEGPCAGFWWEDVVGGEYSGDDEWWSRLTMRDCPAFSYYANAPLPYFQPVYKPGLLGSFPLSRLAVVAGADAEQTYERLARSVSVPLSLVEE